jgi:hypothetical protein
MVREEQGQESLKLVELSRWRPCGLTLFGRRVSIADIVITIITGVIVNLSVISGNKSA